jgi:DNA repair exonuclease SbcCD ATPase subunit
MSSIRIGKVDIENFLLIRKASIDFSKRGLVGVFGPNGVGKSSLILESLLYGLFGVSERFGTERDKVVNRFVGSGCHLHIPMSIEPDDTKVELDVYRKHPKFKDEVFLKVNGIDQRGRTNAHTWEKVTKLLDMDHTSFCNSVVFGQSTSQYFSSLSDAQQKGIVERLLGMSWIPKAYEIVTKDRDKVDKELDALAGKYDELKAKLKEVEEQVAYYQEKELKFEIERGKKLSDLESSFEVPEDASALEDTIKGLERKIATDEGLLSDKEKLSKEDLKIALEINSLETNAKIKMGEISKIEAKIVSLKNFKVPGETIFCDACGQEITVASKQAFIEHLNKDMTPKILEMESYNVKIKEKAKEREPLSSALSTLMKLEKSYKLTLQALNKWKADLATVNVWNATVEEKNLGVRNRIDEVRAEVNTFKEIIANWEEKGRKLSLEVGDHLMVVYKEKETEEKYCEALVEVYSNRGFKSFVIESVLPDMDRFAAIYSRALGGKYEITFSPQSILKKGEVREKFNVGVLNRFGAADYEGNSSGEKRAVDSIVMFVLGDLAASRLNNRVSLLILDDVFEKLDEESCASVINVLRMMVSPKGTRDEEFKDLPERESVFVLTHLEQFKDNFENKIRVGRKENGETAIYGE